MGFIEPGKSVKRRRIRNRVSENRVVKKFGVETNENVQNYGSILEKLPLELIQEIFTNIKLEENNLPLVNNHLNRALKIRCISQSGNEEKWTNLWLVERFMKRFYLHDLNKNIYLDKIIVQLKRVTSHINFNKDMESYEKLVFWINEYIKHGTALDSSFFKFKFINKTFISQLKDKGFIVLSADEIMKAKKIRASCMLKLWNTFCCNLAEMDINIDDITPFNMVTEQSVGNSNNSSGTEETNNERDSNTTPGDSDMKGYKGCPNFPENFYSGISTEERFELVQTMKEVFKFNFYDKNLILSNTFTKIDLHSCVILYEIMKFLIESNESADELLPRTIIELFKAIARHEHSNPLILDNLYPCILLILSTFYRQGNARHKDDDIWLYVKSVKNLTLFGILLKFNNNPSDEILKSMDL